MRKKMIIRMIAFNQQETITKLNSILIESRKIRRMIEDEIREDEKSEE